MGGALVGGYISNQGQEQHFENEREAARDDLRKDSYANYLQAGYGLLFQEQLKQAGEKVTNDELAAGAQTLVGAQSAVALFGNPKFEDLTNELLNAFANEDVETAQDVLGKIRDLAKEDITSNTR
jgi:hypothetical protein